MFKMTPFTVSAVGALRHALTAAVLVGSLAGCNDPAAIGSVTATTTTGKTVISAAKIGNDAIQLGNTLNLMASLDQLEGTANAAADAAVTKAAAALIAAGQSASTSTAVSGDLSSNVQLAFTAVQALLAGYSTTSAKAPAVAATVATKIASYDQVLVNLAKIYNTDAGEYGLPTVTVPAL